MKIRKYGHLSSFLSSMWLSFLLVVTSQGSSNTLLAFAGRGWNSLVERTADYGLRRKNLSLNQRYDEKYHPHDDDDDDFPYEPPYQYSCEVVGAFGRVGSFWLCHGADDGNVRHYHQQQDDDKENIRKSSDKMLLSLPTSAVPVPRGVSPGCWTKVGCPIYVATPSAAWSDIWNQTLMERRQDLVFVGNGLPSFELSSATVIVPHFAILKICRKDDNDNDCIQTNHLSPKTFLYGKHAYTAAKILEQHGVQTQVVGTFTDIYEKAARKLLWASCMWLICREDGAINDPLTVAQAHEQKQDALNKLVDEIYPALVELVGRPVNRTELDEYLRDYSLSIGHAIPSFDAAVAEVQERNGAWLSRRRKDETPQTYHQKLLERVAGTDVLEQTTERFPTTTATTERRRAVDASNIGLTFWGVENCAEDNDPAAVTDATSVQQYSNVVIVGGGIIGSSLALFLAQRRPDLNITVLDQLPASNAVGRTTPASWAWLNANKKSPKHYQVLNQLGMHVWKQESHLSKLVSWMGSMVRFEEPPKFVNDGGYPAEGPLSQERIAELEPLANWKLSSVEQHPKEDGYTYFFPDEGCVDPTMAVHTLQQAAADIGVCFVSGANVTSMERDPSSERRITGITATMMDDEKNGSSARKSFGITADLVIVAAGSGASAKGLACGLELLDKPGTIVYASSTKEQAPTDHTEQVHRLSRILVDPFRLSHILQRPNGEIVAGGGALEVGGSGAVGSSSFSSSSLSSSSLLDGAKRLVSPKVLEGTIVTQTCQAVRPMPTDGLPIIGYVKDERNLYVVVTHSGMTLGPLLSSMAAAEIAEGISLDDLIAPYRPTRFHKR